MKRYMMTMLAMVLTLVAIAQKNRIFIEDFEIYPDSSITMPVILANVDSTRGIQFNMTLPVGLRMLDCKLSDYAANEYDMQIFSTVKAGIWTMGMYPMSRVCLPPATQVVMTIKFYATADFKGGELFLWKCRGSTIKNMSIYIDDDTTVVTVPASTLIGIPMDNGSDGDHYFNLIGQPLAPSDGLPAAKEDKSFVKEKQNTRKIAKKR